MKNTKLIAVILCVSMLLMALVGCNVSSGTDEETTAAPTTDTQAVTDETTEEDSTTDAISEENSTDDEEESSQDQTESSNGDETTTEEATTVIEYENKSKFVSFVSYNKESFNLKEITANNTLAGKFNVTEGYLEQVNAFMCVMGDVNFTLYKWNKDYATTVAGEPIKQKTYLKSECAKFESVGMLNIELSFEEDEVGPGIYMYVISAVEGTTNYACFYTGIPWATRELSDDYRTYGTISYVNGTKSANEVAQSNYVFNVKVEKEVVEEATIPTDKDADGTAKVIIIAGQSNAVGVSQISELKRKIDNEKYQEYVNGYSNVQIMYDNCSGNANSDFVNTKLGQAVNTAAFGPEVGMAEYLSKKFPDEKFYIIKYALGGSQIETQWYNAATNQPGELLVGSSTFVGLTSFVQQGLAKIEAQGLTPKIIGFVWNQGESESIWLAQSARYYANQEALVNYIRTTFADYASVKGIGFFDAGIVGNIWCAYRNINIQKYEFSLTSPMNFYIETTDYPIINTLEENNDVAHYDCLGMIKLGQLYGEEIAKLFN